MSNMVSYFNPQTNISILAPLGWDGELIDDNMFRLFSPPAAKHEEYQSTISYLRGQPEGRGMDWLESAIRESEADMRENYPHFTLQAEERYTSSSLALTYVRWYEWKDVDTGFHFSQLQALILSRSFYVVNAATLTPLNAQYMPIFEQIIRSTRIING